MDSSSARTGRLRIICSYSKKNRRRIGTSAKLDSPETGHAFLCLLIFSLTFPIKIFLDSVCTSFILEMSSMYLLKLCFALSCGQSVKPPCKIRNDAQSFMCHAAFPLCCLDRSSFFISDNARRSRSSLFLLSSLLLALFKAAWSCASSASIFSTSILRSLFDPGMALALRKSFSLLAISSLRFCMSL